MSEQFAEDIIKGLASTPKHLPFKYSYDKEGSRLFQAIMGLSDYYLTDAEFEIFYANKSKILTYLSNSAKSFNLIEFGVKDALKTKVLIEYFLNEKTKFNYFPIGIIGHILNMLSKDLVYTFPKLPVKAIHGDYFQALDQVSNKGKCRNIVLFLGANIGSFTLSGAKKFLIDLKNKLNMGDIVVIGFDLKKDPGKIIKAYNDKFGITNEFYLNILNRINEEFHADFNLCGFYHYPAYDPITGEVKNYLISKMAQMVNIEKLSYTIDFEYSEPIFIELAKKYEQDEIELMAKGCGYDIIEHFIDGQNYFLDAFWKVK